VKHVKVKKEKRLLDRGKTEDSYILRVVFKGQVGGEGIANSGCRSGVGSMRGDGDGFGVKSMDLGGCYSEDILKMQKNNFLISKQIQ